MGGVEGSEASFTDHIFNFSRDVLRRGISHGDDTGVADVISAPQEINRLSDEILTLGAKVRHRKHSSQSSSQGTHSLEPNEICERQSTIKELEQNRTREIDGHQLAVAV